MDDSLYLPWYLHRMYPLYLLTCLCNRWSIGGGYALMLPLLLVLVMPDADESTLVPALVSIPLSPQTPPAIEDAELLAKKSL